MRVRLRGFDDCELRLRPTPGQRVDGELLTLGARQIDRALRAVALEVPPVRVRSLVQQTRHRGDITNERELMSALRRRIELGEIVIVRRSLLTVDPGPIEPSVPPVREPYEPEGIVEDDDWIEILVVDQDDEPMLDVAFELELPDGSIRRGRTNRLGIARCDAIPSGTCKLTLVELDESAWALSS